jgi:hypothetical protein
MTKLEELTAAREAAWVAAHDAEAAAFAWDAACDAYCAELKKTQKEKQNDEESYCSIIPRGC